METANETMEKLLETIRKAGWRMSNLSHVGRPDKYSCILEREKPTNDGFGVFAASELVSDPREALAQAWANAQIKAEELNKVKPSGIRPSIELIEKSPMAGKVVGALSRWLDALDPQEDF